MSLFKKDDSVQESQEFSGFKPLASGVYKGTIKRAYITLDKGKNGININMNWEIDIEGKPYKETKVFIAKMVNGTPVYYSTDDKGVKTEYMKFSALNRHLNTLINKSIFDENVLVDKVLSIYDFQTKKDVETSVKSIDDIVGLEAAFGIVENHKNNYKDPSKITKYNSIEKVWKLVNDLPFSGKEIEAGLDEPQDCKTWQAEWAGTVNERELDKKLLNGGTSAQGTKELDIG